MDSVANLLDNYPIQTGLFFMLISFLLFALDVFLLDKPKIKNLLQTPWRKALKNWSFLLLFFIYGLGLVLKSI